MMVPSILTTSILNGTKQHRSIGPRSCSLVWLLCEIPICFSKKLSISSVIKNKILKALQYVVDQFLTDLYKYLRYICNRWRMSFSNSPICKIWSSPHNELSPNSSTFAKYLYLNPSGQDYTRILRKSVFFGKIFQYYVFLGHEI